MQRSLSFNTKLKRTHSDHCKRKGTLLLTRKNVEEHRFDILKEDMLTKEILESKIIKFNRIYDDILKDYNSVMNTGSPTEASDRLVWDNSLTNGLDFSCGKKMKMYEILFEELREKLIFYKGMIECLGDNGIEEKFMESSMKIVECADCLRSDEKGKIHSACKCPNIVMSCKGEECEICYEEGIKLFDIQCGNKHMLCYPCLFKLFDDSDGSRGSRGSRGHKVMCPFCREDVCISASSLVQIERLAGLG